MAKRHVLLAILLASIGAVAPAKAEEVSRTPHTWVVPFAPGGITDTTSRIVAEEMSEQLRAIRPDRQPRRCWRCGGHQNRWRAPSPMVTR